MMKKRLTDVVGTLTDSDGSTRNMYSDASLTIRYLNEGMNKYPNAYDEAREGIAKNEAEYAVIEKLGQCEDIEDKWGINFSVVDEALEKGIYAECLDGKIRYFKYVHIFKQIGKYWIYAFDNRWQFQDTLSDFGNHWALSEGALK